MTVSQAPPLTKEPRAAFIRAPADARRLDLIAACARTLAKKGAHGCSVREICAEAGVSSGLLRHYFAGIDDLIAETYRQTGHQVQAALEAAVAKAGTDPKNRLLAYLTASFAPPIADADLLATWLAFWSLTRTDPAVAALHGEIYAENRHALERLLEAYAPARDHRLMAVALTALVDGLWLELSLGDAPFSPEEATLLAERWLETLAR
ncbi:MAG: TetR family transcriptional regulator C-terminal domain-containing protein [Chakrabartia sp.]